MSQVVVAVAGGCAGLLGGLLARKGIAFFTHSARLEDQLNKNGWWKRSALIGILASAAILYLFSRDAIPVLTVLTCLVLSIVSAAAYVLGWFTLSTKYGLGASEAGEVSLAVTITLTAFLHVCGLLWITLILLGCLMLLAATVLNGFWIYRLR